MSDFEIDLPSYAEVIDDNQFKYVIFGNGLSVGVNSSFSYGSLYRAAIELGIIKDESKELFEAFGSSDFEYLLRKLSQASTVNKILNLEHLIPAQKYMVIKRALITAVSRVHPKRSSISEEWLQQTHDYLSTKHSVFSLNYDLILYWIAGMGNFDKFTDFFWSDNLTFDPTNLAPYYNRTMLYYPHGALFLFEDIQGSIGKIRSLDGTSALDQIATYLENYSVPVFISEGTSQDKFRRIKNNTYLAFAYQRMQQMRNGVIIYGTSLSKQDAHIVDAIRQSGVRKLAYGIHPGNKTSIDVETIKANVKQTFQNSIKEFYFFDSTTCPLSYPQEL